MGLEVSDLLKGHPASLRVSAHTANLLFQDNWLTVSRDYFQANFSCPLVPFLPLMTTFSVLSVVLGDDEHPDT